MKGKLIAAAALVAVVMGICLYSFISGIETFKPNFPNNFDTLVIRQDNQCWIIKRNEAVDEFIRDSYQVSEHIGEGPDFCILDFMLKDKEVFAITYDDIGYPADSVKKFKSLIRDRKRYYCYFGQDNYSNARENNYYTVYGIGNKKLYIFDNEIDQGKVRQYGFE